MTDTPKRPADVRDLAPSLVGVLTNLEPDHGPDGILMAVLRLWPEVLHASEDTMTSIVRTLTAHAASLRANADQVDELIATISTFINRHNMQSDYVRSLEHRVQHLAGALTPPGT